MSEREDKELLNIAQKMLFENGIYWDSFNFFISLVFLINVSVLAK